MKKRAIVKLIRVGKNIEIVHIIARCPNGSIGIYTMDTKGNIFNKNFICGKLTKNPIPINIYNVLKKCNASSYRYSKNGTDIFYVG